MIKDWQTINFEEAIEKITYTNKIPRSNFLSAGKFPIISQEEDFINGYWNDEKDVFKLVYPVIIFGDHTQILKYVDFDFVLGADGVKVLQPKSFLNPRFFYYFLQSVKLKSLGYARHYRLLKEVSVSFPESLSEQKRIVKILDDAFLKISMANENAEKNLQNSRQLFESYMHDIFANPSESWDVKPLSEICTKITDGVHKKPVYLPEGIPFIKINNLTEGPGISFKEVSYISAKDHEDFCKRTMPEKGDILITKDGTIGVVRVIETDIEFSIFVSVALIKPISKTITPYLRYVLESPIIQNQIKPKGAALKHLYLKDLREFNIPIPPAKIQKDIVNKLSVLSKKTKDLEENYKQKIADLDELKKSLLTKAFAGEL